MRHGATRDRPQRDASQDRSRLPCYRAQPRARLCAVRAPELCRPVRSQEPTAPCGRCSNPDGARSVPRSDAGRARSRGRPQLSELWATSAACLDRERSTTWTRAERPKISDLFSGHPPIRQRWHASTAVMTRDRSAAARWPNRGWQISKPDTSTANSRRPSSVVQGRSALTAPSVRCVGPHALRVLVGHTRLP